MSTPGAPAPPQPPPAGGSFDLMRAFRILFDDPDWVKKTLIGGVFVLLSGVIIGVFFLAGYAARTLRNAARGDAQPLPDWEDMGGLFNDGLAPVGAGLVYGLGAALIPGSILCVVGLVVGGLGSSGGGDGMEAIAALGIAVAYGLFFLFGLAVWVFFPAAFTKLVLEDRFSAIFEFSAIVDYIKRNAGNYLLAILAYLVANFVSSFGFLLLCVGIFPAIFWSYVVAAWSLGEAARLDPGRRA